MHIPFEALTPAAAAYTIGIAAVLGACLGSFTNCLAWRVVAGESVLKGRSHCPECNHALGILDLIPIVSWLALRGKCRYCKAKVSPRYVIVEIIMATVFALLAWRFGIGVATLAYMALACILCAVTLVDADTYTIPNGFIIAGIIVWAATVWFMEPQAGGFGIGTLFVPYFGYGFLAVLVDGLAGGFAVGIGMLLLSLLFDKIMGKQTLGGGDVKLFFMVGLFLGLLLGVFNVLLSCIIGLVIAFVGNALSGSRASSEEEGSGDPSSAHDDENAEEPLPTRAIPFGPAISIAAILTLFVGSSALTWYIGLLV